MHARDGSRMHPLENLISYEEALRRVLAASRPVREAERVPLAEAAGRVLAELLKAAIDVPGFDRAAMDGYAVGWRETAGASESAPIRLRLAAVVHAERGRPSPLGRGTCVQVATGAPLPPGADAVVMVERTRREGRHVDVLRPVRSAENVTFRGSDIRRGSRPLEAGRVLTPARLAVAAALGKTHVPVWRRPRVLLLSTGSEVRRPGTRLRPGEVYNSNAVAVAALLGQHGAAVVDAGPVADSVPALRRAFAKGRRADLILVSGGSSAGERDLLEEALRSAGRVSFHGVRVKPGKPLLLGSLRGRTVLGLPGYPASCLCDAYLFAVPAIRRMARLPALAPQRERARLAAAIRNASGRHFFVPVRLVDGTAIPTYKESGATTSVSEADGFLEVPAHVTNLQRGAPVLVTRF